MDTKINEVKRIVFSLIDLYGDKDINGEELLKRYKERSPTAGENYDKMLVVDYVKTKYVPNFKHHFFKIKMYIQSPLKI